MFEGKICSLYRPFTTSLLKEAQRYSASQKPDVASIRSLVDKSFDNFAWFISCIAERIVLNTSGKDQRFGET